MGVLTRLDRRAGAALRPAVRAVPAGPDAARIAAGALSPGFRALVAVLIARPSTRRLGLEALAAGVAAALAARALRDGLARPRPGGRTEGGFPSRHAAAATAIARAAGRRRPALGGALALAAAVGLAARVADAEHEPADILAGVALGLAAQRALERLASDGIALPG
jgi:membrane-associated phospholipid phosphatase